MNWKGRPGTWWMLLIGNALGAMNGVFIMWQGNWIGVVLFAIGMLAVLLMANLIAKGPAITRRYKQERGLPVTDEQVQTIIGAMEENDMPLAKLIASNLSKDAQRAFARAMTAYAAKPDDKDRPAPELYIPAVLMTMALLDMTPGNYVLIAIRDHKATCTINGGEVPNDEWFDSFVDTVRQLQESAKAREAEQGTLQ